MEKIVLSGSIFVDKPKTTIISNDIVHRIREIKNQAGKHILMFGSPTVFDTLNEHQLIDEF